jgi:hypothetical protein
MPHVYDACIGDSIVIALYDTMFAIDPPTIEVLLERFNGTLIQVESLGSPNFNFVEPTLVYSPRIHRLQTENAVLLLC